MTDSHITELKKNIIQATTPDGSALKKSEKVNLSKGWEGFQEDPSYCSKERLKLQKKNQLFAYVQKRR